MLFADFVSQDAILNRTRTVQSELLKARTALRANRAGNAENHVEEALNQLIHIMQHLQTTHAVTQIPYPNHEPAVLWFDQPTLERLIALQQETGYSVKQVIIELLQQGRLPGEDGS